MILKSRRLLSRFLREEEEGWMRVLRRMEMLGLTNRNRSLGLSWSGVSKIVEEIVKLVDYMMSSIVLPSLSNSKTLCSIHGISSNSISGKFSLFIRGRFFEVDSRVKVRRRERVQGRRRRRTTTKRRIIEG